MRISKLSELSDKTHNFYTFEAVDTAIVYSTTFWVWPIVNESSVKYISNVNI